VNGDDIFTPEQLAAMAADRPVLMTAVELGRLFGLSADEIRNLAAKGLGVEVGSLFEWRGRNRGGSLIGMAGVADRVVQK